MGGSAPGREAVMRWTAGRDDRGWRCRLRERFEDMLNTTHIGNEGDDPPGSPPRGHRRGKNYLAAALDSIRGADANRRGSGLCPALDAEVPRLLSGRGGRRTAGAWLTPRRFRRTFPFGEKGRLKILYLDDASVTS